MSSPETLVQADAIVCFWSSNLWIVSIHVESQIEAHALVMFL